MATALPLCNLADDHVDRPLDPSTTPGADLRSIPAGEWASRHDLSPAGTGLSRRPRARSARPPRPDRRPRGHPARTRRTERDRSRPDRDLERRDDERSGHRRDAPGGLGAVELADPGRRAGGIPGRSPASRGSSSTLTSRSTGSASPGSAARPPSVRDRVDQGVEDQRPAVVGEQPSRVISTSPASNPSCRRGPIATDRDPVGAIQAMRTS